MRTPPLGRRIKKGEKLALKNPEDRVRANIFVRMTDEEKALCQEAAHRRFPKITIPLSRWAREILLREATLQPQPEPPTNDEK